MLGTVELARLLRAQRALLLDDWKGRVMAVESARSLTAPALVDHLPALIDGLIEGLEHDGDGLAGVGGDRQSPARDAPRHGVERLADGYDIEEVVVELSILRESVLSLVDRQGSQLSMHALRVFNVGIDRLMAEAVGAYAGATTQTLKHQQERHLAFAAHDLRTPLGAMSLALAALERAMPQRDADAAAIVPRMLRSLRRNIQRLSQRIEAVLASNGDGELRPHPVPLRLRPLVADLVRALGERARAAGTRLVVDVPAELELQADPALVGRALENLIVNAIKSAPRGTVHICAANEGDRIACWVQDDGHGIAPDRLLNLFDAAQSVDAPLGDHGLGLAIVREVVEAHDGRVSVVSDDGGSTFRIELPAVSRTAGTVSPPPPATP